MPRKMKDSGIEWVGQIPEEWSVMSNKYVMTKYKLVKPQYNGEDILSLTMNGVIVRDLEAGGKMPASFNGYQTLFPGNLLMCLFDYDVTPRCIGLVKNEGVTSPAYSQFKMNNGFSAEYYYYYYLMVDHTKALLHLAKNLRHSFTEEQLGMISIPVPPLDTQRRIASFLDSKCAEIDSLRADIEKEIETLEEYKKSVITEAVTKGLDPNVPMKDSGIEWIGEIPKIWTSTKLGRICSLITDGTHQTPNYIEDGYPFISIKDISSGKIDFSDVKYISEEEHKKLYSHAPVRRGDILFTRIGTLGVFVEVDTDILFDFFVSVGMLRLKPNCINPHYLLHYLNSRAVENFIQSIKAGFGTAAPKYNLSDVYRTWVLLPPPEEQDCIASFLDAKCAEINELLSQKQQQLLILDEYKKTIIYEYVTGKKEVPAV